MTATRAPRLSVKLTLGVIAIALLALTVAARYWLSSSPPAEAVLAYDGSPLIITGLNPPKADLAGSASPSQLRPRFQPTPVFERLEGLAEKRTAKARLSGTVKDTFGQAIKQAQVSIFLGRDRDSLTMHDLYKEVQVDDKGRFEIHLTAPFKGWIRVDGPRRSPVEEFVRLGFSEAVEKTYVLPRSSGVLAGIVREEGSLRPLPHARVFCNFVDKASGNGRPSMRSTSTDSRGRYELENLPMGRKFFINFSTHEHLLKVEWLTLNDEAQEHRLNVLLTPGAKVRVRIADEHGQVIPQAQIKNRFRGASWTNADGEAEILTDPTSEAPLNDFLISADGYLDRSVKISVVNGDVQEYLLQEASTFEVLVIDRESRPIAGAEVVIWAAPRVLSSKGTTDQDGYLAVQANQDTVHKVGVSHRDFLGVEVERGVHDSESRLEVVLERGSGGLAGRILTSSGLPARTVVLTLRRHRSADPDVTGVLRRRFAGVDGRFVVLGLPEGSYELSVIIDGAPREGLKVRNIEIRERFVLTDLNLTLQPF